MRLSKNLFIITILFLSICVPAQNSLSGKIFIAQDGRPLEGATVFIPLLQKGTASSADGSFTLAGIPGGRFEIQFRRVGYMSKIEMIDFQSSVSDIKISLQPTEVELGEVLILGNSLNVLERSPYKVEILTADQIRANGFITLQNSLSVVPGVSELSNGFSISKPVIRGMFGYRTAAMVNGVRFDNQEWQNEHGFGLGATGVGSIEIIEGPAALLYGANMIGGAVNFLPPSFAPAGKHEGEASLGVFTNTLGANMDISMKSSVDEKLQWQLHLGGNTHADYLNGNGTKIPNTRFAGFSARGLVNYFHSWGITNIDYNFGYSGFGVVEANNLNNPKDLAEDHFERGFEGPHHIISYNILSVNNTFSAGSSIMKLNLGFQNNNRMENEGSEVRPPGTPDPGELDLMLNTFSYRGEIIHPVLENSFITAGVQGSIQDNKNEGSRYLVPDAGLTETSVFSYLKSNFSQVILEGGARYDINTVKTNEHATSVASGFMPANDLKYATVNGALGLSYAPAESWIFKVNAATGFRSPNLSELASNGVHEGTTRYEQGNSSLLSEKNIQYDAGVSYIQKNLRISLNGFDNEIKNYIYLLAAGTSDASGNKYYDFTQTDARFFGGEAVIDSKLPSFGDISVSYSKVTGKSTGGSYLPFIPADKCIVQLKFELPDMWMLKTGSLMLRARNYLAQNNPGAGETPTPGYSLFDIGLYCSVNVYSFPLKVSLNGMNILNKMYISHLSLLKPYGIADMGMNYSLSVSTPFEF